MSILPWSVVDKDPDSVLDWEWDWATWLPAGDTIASGTIIITPAGLTLNSSSNTSSSFIMWLSNGVSGILYDVTNRIWTTGGRKEDSTIFVRIKEK